MQKIFTDKYLQLGGKIREAQHVMFRPQLEKQLGIAEGTLEAHFSAEHGDLPTVLSDLGKICKDLGLTTSSVLIEQSADEAPLRTAGELDIVVRAVISELKTQAFFFVPAHRAKYYDLILPSIVTGQFPSASKEIVDSGNSYATAQHTASVFHAMRATEIGIRTLATELGVTFSFPMELAEWGQIVGQIEPKIDAIGEKPRSAKRDADLKFYSEAASQFRYFNNGWRIRVAHARERYDEEDARKILDHVIDFFQTLAKRDLKE